MDKLFSVLDELKALLDQKRPLPIALTKNLHENLILNWTYHSNAIEGNSLTIKETKVVLEGITVGGKTFHEHLEVNNHRDAIALLEGLVSDDEALSERHIRALHQTLRKNIDHDNNKGEQRCFWHQGEVQSLHPIERAALVHCEFIKSSPFDRSNGTVARLLINFELLKAGFPAAVIRLDQAHDYLSALNLVRSAGDSKPITILIANSVIESFKTYFWALGMTEVTSKLC